MSVEVTIPELGESITEVVLTKWHKASGDYVEKDENLYEVESDKITTDVPAIESGIVQLTADEGAELEIGTVVATIDPSAEKPAGTSSNGTATKEQAESGKAAATSDSDNTASEDDADIKATPLARNIARDKGISLSDIQGSGTHGRITKSDVLAAEANSKTSSQTKAKSPDATSSKTAASTPIKVRSTTTGNREVRTEKMTKLRQRIAERLVYAKNTTAMLTTFNECDMSAIMELRKKYKESFKEKHGIGLGFMSFFVKACCGALREFPRVNAYIVDDSIEYHDFVDISIAVSTEKGLTVPILRDAESLGFAEIEAGIMDLALKARDGKLTMDDLQGGTFTITNGGIFGSLNSTPILNPPQSGILGMHAIKKRPIEDPANPGNIVLRPMMHLALSYDHRIVDGKEAVQFLVHIKDALEDPQRLMLEL